MNATMPKIISRADAKALGLKRYFTGEPCCEGHKSARNTITRACLECKKEGMRQRRGKFYISEKLKELRTQATISGSSRYFTARACSNGHLAERRTSDGRCVECVRQRKRREALDPRYREARNIRVRRYLSKPENQEKCRARTRRYKQTEQYRQKAAAAQKRRRNENREEHLERERLHRKNNLDMYRSAWRDYYRNGPKNPKGEKQWLRKNQAQLRTLRRALRNVGVNQSQSGE